MFQKNTLLAPYRVMSMKIGFFGAIGLILVGFFASNAQAWSARGHKTVGEVAFGLVSNNVRIKITALLGPNDIQHAAVWPDLLRDPPAGDTEMQQFITAHPDNTDWHFINLPIKSTAYDPNGPFARPNDIIHQINLCIDVLEGVTPSPPVGGEGRGEVALSKTHALRWLVLLVGGLHQPLHVGSGHMGKAEQARRALPGPSKRPGTHLIIRNCP